MRWLALLVVAAALFSCRGFTKQGDSTPGCRVDADCQFGICNSGSCDSSLCRRDGQCSSQLCLTVADGGAPGTCGVRECTVDGDCQKAGRVCESTPQGRVCAGECGTDLECARPQACALAPSGKGSCAGSCWDRTDCLANQVCFSPRSPQSACGVGCFSDADCGATGFCSSLPDAGVAGLCQQTQHCAIDADCPGCSYCSGGTCLGEAGDGGAPDIVGDRSRLRMSDNLQPALAFMQQQHPSAKLVQIAGYEPDRLGTIDIANPGDGLARWTYDFAIGDGGPDTRFLSVQYLSQAHKCAVVLDPGPQLLSADPISAPLALHDATEVIALMSAHPGCDAPDAGSTEDVLYFGIDDGGTEVLVTTASRDSFVGDPAALTGVFNCQ